MLQNCSIDPSQKIQNDHERPKVNLHPKQRKIPHKSSRSISHLPPRRDSSSYSGWQRYVQASLTDHRRHPETMSTDYVAQSGDPVNCLKYHPLSLTMITPQPGARSSSQCSSHNPLEPPTCVNPQAFSLRDTILRSSTPPGSPTSNLTNPISTGQPFSSPLHPPRSLKHLYKSAGLHSTSDQHIKSQRELSKFSLAQFFTTTQELDGNWIGVAETHLDSRKSHVRESLKSARVLQIALIT